MHGKITLAHGDGGRSMHELIEDLRLTLSNKALDELADAAELQLGKSRIAFSTDSYVVKPIFFPGGDIGKLAVCGTVNDISMKAARPLFISLSLIVEEGFPLSDLNKIISSIKRTATQAKVHVVTGDIKVVEKGAADGIFINTAGLGVIKYPARVGSKANNGDAIILSGSIAEHGMAILNARENLKFKSSIKSDCDNVNFQVEKCLKASRNISVMRDPTRGGLATVLNEIARSSGLGIDINEKAIPIKPAVKSLCKVLGFDPLYVANEGKFVCFVAEKDARVVKRALGLQASIIGKVTTEHKGEVHLNTNIGTSRLLIMPESGQLPRIC